MRGRKHSRGSARDRAALGALLSFPFLLLIAAFYAHTRWTLPLIDDPAKQDHNPNTHTRWTLPLLDDPVKQDYNPSHITRDVLSANSLLQCLASQPIATAIGEFKMTRLYMPLIRDYEVGYITRLGDKDPSRQRFTTWGIIRTAACQSNQTTLPEPYGHVTLHRDGLNYNYTTKEVTTVTAWCYGENMQATAFGMGEHPYAYCAITTSWPESDQRGGVIQWKTTTTDLRYSGLTGFGEYVVMGSTSAGAIPKTTAVTTKEIASEEAWWDPNLNPPSRTNAHTSSEVKETGSSIHIATPTKTRTIVEETGSTKRQGGR